MAILVVILLGALLLGVTVGLREPWPRHLSGKSGGALGSPLGFPNSCREQRNRYRTRSLETYRITAPVVDDDLVDVDHAQVSEILF